MAYGGYEPYDKQELHELMSKADEYVDNIDNMVSCEDLVRDKDAQYFNKVMHRDRGQMIPYVKDHHGDPRCPINGVIHGLFFSPLIEGSNMNQSIYGRKRLEVYTSSLIAYNDRAYFADFYCVSGKTFPRPHYVTVVITKTGTAADGICRKRLVALQINNNPFFQVRKSGAGINACIASSSKLHVELLYTDTVPVRQLLASGEAILQNMKLAKYGSEQRTPKSKSGLCQHCNLNDDEEEEEDDDDEDYEDDYDNDDYYDYHDARADYLQLLNDQFSGMSFL